MKDLIKASLMNGDFEYFNIRTHHIFLVMLGVIAWIFDQEARPNTRNFKRRSEGEGHGRTKRCRTTLCCRRHQGRQPVALLVGRPVPITIVFAVSISPVHGLGKPT